MQGIAFVGQLMRIAMDAKRYVDDVIEVHHTDTNAMKRLKHLIIRMTQPRAEDRPTMEAVEMELAQIQGQWCITKV